MAVFGGFDASWSGRPMYGRHPFSHPYEVSVFAYACMRTNGNHKADPVLSLDHRTCMIPGSASMAT